MTQSSGAGRMVYVGVGLAFALFLLSFLVYQISLIVLMLLLTMLFSIIISGPVDYLARRGIGRGLGTLIVLGAAALVLFLAGAAIAPIVENQARQLVEQFPILLNEVQNLIGQLQRTFGINLGPSLEPERVFESARGFLSGDFFAVAADVGGSIVNAISLAVVALIATVYLVISPRPLVNGFVSLFPAGWRPRTREILGKMYHAVQNWFLGQLASMTLIGVLSAIALSIIGIPFAVLLGLISGLISFIPFIGPVLSVIPPTLLALADDPIKAVWVVVAYIAIQQVESHLIQPLVMSRAVSLHPAVIVFALLIMGTLFGFIGLLLAVPLVAALQVLLRELWVRRMDAIGTDPAPPEEAKQTVKPEARKRMRRLWRALTGLFRS